MHYIIYRVTNAINGHEYTGKHQTDDLNDGYLGSGNLIKKAIQKYGKQYFEREILFKFDSEVEMVSKEIELVTEEYCARKDTYNIAIGGQGGCIVLKKEHPLFESTCKAISLKKKEKLALRSIDERREMCRAFTMTGKSHRKASIELIRQKLLNAIRVKCKFCGIVTNRGNYTKWHGDKCKSAPESF